MQKIQQGPWGSACRRAVMAMAFATGLAGLTGLTACSDDDRTEFAATPAVATPVVTPAASAPAASTPTATLQAVTLAAKADKSYGMAKSGGSTIEVFRDGSSGAVTQSRYANPQTSEQVRVFNDSDGAPERVVDERSGNTLTITRTSADRVDYRAYAPGGAYLGGWALLSRADGFYVALVTATPSFSGQLAAQLNGAAQTGSFSLLPTSDAGLGALVPVSAAVLALADNASRTAQLSSSGQAHAQAEASVLAVALAAAAIDRRAIVAGWVAGSLLSQGSWAPALLGGGFMAFGLQPWFLPVFDGLRDASTLDQLADNLNTLLDRFQTGVAGSVALSDALSGALAAHVRNGLRRAFDPLLDIVSALVNRSTLAVLTARALAGDTTVAGFGVDQSGMSYTLAGNVSAAGSLTATATPADNGNTVLINGNITGTMVSGTISGRLGNGTVSGNAAALGQCAALTQSGGQGTFSYAFDAGASAGSVSFYREAYSIPDGFRVLSNGQTLYDTKGLVSGNETKALALAGSRTVFVLVNAPNSGTAWEFKLGCPV